jgi:hypothetical protein
VTLEYGIAEGVASNITAVFVNVWGGPMNAAFELPTL